MHTLAISPTQPELTRRTFLFGAAAAAAAASVLTLSRLGAQGVERGFRGSPNVTGYSATEGRFRRGANGFVRCAANEERLCVDPAGAFTGQYLQGADTYQSAPWDDVAAPHTSGSPAFLTTSAGGTIAYAGAHSEPDIFGTTGKGVLLTQTATQNGFHTANNVVVTAVQIGNLIRAHAILSISNAVIPGQVQLRYAGTVHTFSHDATGVITGQVEAWSSRRAGFHDMGVINGKRWWYIWADYLAINTNNATVGIGYGNVTADAGKRFHVCELMIQKNPQTAPAAVPVCKANASFAADTLTTLFGSVGFYMEGCASARSQLVAGAIVPPAIPVGLPYEPLETRIRIIASAESADRAGPGPNPNLLLYARPWGTPVNHNLFYVPAWYDRDWYRGSATGDAATNVNVRSVFQARPDMAAVLGNMSTSSTFVTNLSIDGVILLAGGDTRTTYREQDSVLTASGSSFHFQALTSVAVTNCLAIGSTLWATRARHEVQQDDTDERRVYMGELSLQTMSNGSSISTRGTRCHNMARTTVGTNNIATTFALDTTGMASTLFWMDHLFVAQGTCTGWTSNRMFGALTTAHEDLFLVHSERPIRISINGGASFSDLSPGFDVTTMPHGHLAQHIGTWNFDTQTFTATPDPAKALRVRYWTMNTFASNQVSKPGFQWVASQMDYGDHTRWPSPGDVFRIVNGSQVIDVTFQGGEWRVGGYVRYTGLNVDLPAGPAVAVSNDFIQINRTVVNAVGLNTLDGCVFIGPKGSYFLTGSANRAATDSALDNFFVSNTVVVSNGSSNALRWDWSRTNDSDCSLSNALFIDAASKRTVISGTGQALSIGAAGAGNRLAIGSNVTIISGRAAGGLEAPTSGATITGTPTLIAAGVRSNFNVFSAPDPKVPQYLPGEFYDAVQGRAKLPSASRIFDFDLTAFADTDAGFGARAVIAAAKGDHPRWNGIIAQLKSWFHKVPDLIAVTANSAAVGTNLGAATGTIDRRYGGDIDRRFEVVGGQLQVRASLAGLNAIFVLRTTTGQLLVVDVRP